MEKKNEHKNIGNDGVQDKIITDSRQNKSKSFNPINHDLILNALLQSINEIDFQKLAFPETAMAIKKIAKIDLKIKSGASPDELAALKEDRQSLSSNLKAFVVKQKHYVIITIEQIMELAKKNNLAICKQNEFLYTYNGAYWSSFHHSELQVFLGKAAEKMSAPKWEARYFVFQDLLFKQFMAVAHKQKPELNYEVVLINFKNGTFEIGVHKQVLRSPDSKDFLTYQLPFEYDNTAKASLFQIYLNKVQPDEDRQKILAEYLAYLFISPTTLKLEKTLILYGSGANGKSVFFEIVNALLGGNENVSSYSLQSLTNGNGYYRAMLANKLVNYASEINGKLENAIFKQLVSGEPVEARLPYGKPFTLNKYAKLIFNCNELPRDVEQSHAFFRRFLIVPFEVTIPEDEQDKELSRKIIEVELSGVFNWVLEGLERLLSQKNFTKSEAVAQQLENYKNESDSVLLFIQDEGYSKSSSEYEPLKNLFILYRNYCNDSGYHSCSIKKLSERLKSNGFIVERKAQGNVVYLIKDLFFPTYDSLTA